MGKFIDALANGATGGVAGAVSGIVNTGMGLLLEGHNDRRQLRQQGKLNEQQWKFDQRAIDYNYQKQLEMWNATNYEAQMAHLKNAGLNPGLIYGMGGAGGATVGSGGGGGTHAQGAPQGGGEVMGAMGMGLQLELLKAQKEVMLSQAEKNKAEAAKTAGVDTREAETRIVSLTQGVENQKAAEKLTKAETFLKNLQGTFEGASMEDRLDQVYWNTKQAMTNVQLAEQEAYLGSKTMNDKITIVRQEAIGAALRNMLTTAQTQLTKAQTGKVASDIAVNEAQIQKWAQEIAIGWEGLDRQERELKVKDFEAELKEKYPGIMNVIGKHLDSFAETIFSLTPRGAWKPGGVKSDK